MERNTDTSADKADANFAPLDPDAIARVESFNGLLQFDAAIAMAERAIDSKGAFKLDPQAICELNRIATNGLTESAGKFRQMAVVIDGSQHQPPPASEAPALLHELCDYITANWDQPAIRLAAYVMWRINWIHPFEDGNGRTSRVVSYMVLCIRLGFILPGKQTIPEQLAADKQLYYRALEAADRAFAANQIDVSPLEKLLELALTRQLADVINQAVTG
jgi:Fic family protein